MQKVSIRGKTWSPCFTLLVCLTYSVHITSLRAVLTLELTFFRSFLYHSGVAADLTLHIASGLIFSCILLYFFFKWDRFELKLHWTTMDACASLPSIDTNLALECNTVWLCQTVASWNILHWLKKSHRILLYETMQFIQRDWKLHKIYHSHQEGWKTGLSCWSVLFMQLFSEGHFWKDLLMIQQWV